MYNPSMVTIEQKIPRTYDEAVGVLARWHGEGGAPDLRIFAFPDPDQQVVQLLHVSESFPDPGSVRVYRLGRSEEFPFKSAVALTIPIYWERIEAGADLLPSGWDPKTAKRVWPDDRA